MIFRFVIYGLLGLALEVLWTSISAKLFRKEESWSLKGTTYVWMFPIYGSVVFLYEPIMSLLTRLNLEWYYRGLIYTVGIFIIEYLTGYLLKRLFGKCPWDYTGARFQLHGFIRFDYAPLWFGLGLLLEPISGYLTKISLPYQIF